MDYITIESIIPDAIVDLRYAGNDNIVGRPLYEKGYQARLARAAAEALASAAESFRQIGYRIVIWDALRTKEAQQELRIVCSDDRYVAVASNHVKGITVDLTLAAQEGAYLDMGTDHDEFNEKAHAAFDGLHEEQEKNRQLLSSVMTNAGFRQSPYEWWHFDFVADTEQKGRHET